VDIRHEIRRTFFNDYKKMKGCNAERIIRVVKNKIDRSNIDKALIVLERKGTVRSEVENRNEIFCTPRQE